MDWIAPRVRKFALIAIVKAYRPTLKLDYLQRLLAFKSPAGLKEFLASHDVTVRRDSTIDCKEASQILAPKDSLLKLGPA